MTNSDLLLLEGKEGNFTAKVRENPRFVDLLKCTSCGECTIVCPVDVSSEHNQGLSERKAIFKQYEQAIPGGYGISKRSIAPCKATCPAHVSIQGFIALMQQKEYAKALKLFKEEHPFPGSCGRVCHHPCESACTRGDKDEPVAIQYLHRYLADLDFEQEESYLPEIAKKRKEKIAIVGSGPAGLTAAYYMAQKGYDVTIFEKLCVKGGMMAVGIPEYRLPANELKKEIDVIEKLGVKIKTNVEFGKDITLKSLKKDGYNSLFMATGLHGSRALGVRGEDLDGVLKGVDFLRDTALGKAKKLSGKVIVIGGGNVAVDVSLTAKRSGADDVTMICLEKRDEMPAWDYEIAEALEEGVKIVNSLGPLRFLGIDGKLDEIEFQECTTVFDENGRFDPQYDDCVLTSYEADYIIVAIGQTGLLDFADKEGIEITKAGGIKTDITTLQTSIDWVFAGGDVVYGPKSVVDAVASGKKAAENMDRFINGQELIKDEKIWDFEKPAIDIVNNEKRLKPSSLSLEKRKDNFKQVILNFKKDKIDNETLRCLSCGICSECYQCVDACLAKAIDHEQTAKIRDLNVGSVILTNGAVPFDPSNLDDIYMYKRSKNVMTSLEFERILSAGGPTMGHLVRPSDEKEPKKIAWLQCIGSRDTNKCGNGYCSSVCCMYAVKDAMIAKEHSEHELDTAIFNMDLRAFGKDYEKYYNRALEQDGVRFVKSRVHSVVEEPGTDNLLLHYTDEKGNMQQEIFDIVVLSVGLVIPQESIDLAKRLDIDLNKYNFVKTDTFNPLQTSRPGVFVAGSFQDPKDIPSSVTQASGSAGMVGAKLAQARHSCTNVISMPEQRDVFGEEPRIGVFICRCGINIAGVIDIGQLEKYTKGLKNVVYVGENLFTCSQDTQVTIKEIIDEHRLNRVVVASCTPKTHEGIFMDTLEEAGLNKYLFEMANIRNQGSWMHFHEPKKATEKAKDLIRMSVARVATLHPLYDKQISVIDKALVLGGGIAGMNSAKVLADQGYKVVIVEKEAELGGFANKLYHTIEGDDIKAYLKELINNIENHEKIEVLKQAMVVDFSGYKGNFNTTILFGMAMEEKKIDHGVMIVATGATEYQPKEFLYNENESVITQLELADKIEEGDISDLQRVIMIQCVGSRNTENLNCSRICCQGAVKNAIALKEKNPLSDVFILYRDMRMYSMLEEYYTKARNLGVIFSRFSQDNPPEVIKDENNKLMVNFKDHVLDRDVQAQADLVVLSAGVRAADTAELSNIIKTGTDSEGFFIEAHVKLRPVEAATEGIFICGTAHSPKLISESIIQAAAAASRAATFLSQEYLTLSAVTAEVDQDKCASCLVCVRSCPYDVPIINEMGVSYIDPALCHGCGICASECPAKTIKLNWYEDEQLLSKVDSMLEGVI